MHDDGLYAAWRAAYMAHLGPDISDAYAREKLILSNPRAYTRWLAEHQRSGHCESS